MAESGCEAVEAAENEQSSGEIPALAEGYSSYDGEEDNPLPKGKRKKSQRRKKSKRSRVEEDSNPSSGSGSEQSSSSEDPSASGSEPDSDEDSEQSEDPHSSKEKSHPGDKGADTHVRFDVQEEEKKVLDLPQDMKDYLMECFSKFTSDKILREKILDQYPAPSLVKAMELDDYVPELFASLSSSFGKSYDQNLSQIQGRIGTVMGPLGKLWKDLENIRKGVSTDSLDIYECLGAVEKSITLLGQAYTSTTYHRRMNILYNLTKDVKDAKQLLKRNDKRLSKHHNLFGKRFYIALSKAASIRKKSKENSQQLGAKHGRKKQKHEKREPRRPFPAEAPRRGSGRGGRVTFSRGRARGARSNQTNRGKRVFFTVSNSVPRTGWNSGKEFCTGGSGTRNELKFTASSSKRSQPHSGGEGASHRGEIEILSTKLAKADTRQFYSSSCSGVTNTLYHHSSADFPPFPIYSREKCNVDRFRGLGHVSKRCYKTSTAMRRSISEPCLFSAKEGWGQQTSNKSEKTQSEYRVPALQDGGHSIAEVFDSEGRLYGKVRPQGGILLSPHAPKFKI